MTDSPDSLEKVHDIYPDVPEAERRNSTTLPEGIALAGPVNHARRRPSHVPRHASGSYPAFKAKQDCALKIGCHELAEEIAKSTGVDKIEVLKQKLTFHRRSQSKLSQQELSELQKATHFDKKELQQWYKGEFGNECWRTKCKGIRNLTDFQVS
jgi:hypothetical protein